MNLVRWSVGLALLTTACSSTPSSTSQPPPSTRVSSGAGEARVLFEVNGIPLGQPKPIPYVEGTIAGVRTKLVLDTGANTHVIARWMADQLGLKSPLSVTGAEHAGRTIDAGVISDPGLTIDGFGPLPRRVMFIVNLPESFETIGVGGIISPQGLVEGSGSVILDLPRHRLARVPTTEIDTRLSSLLPLVTGEIRACEAQQGELIVRSFSVTANVQGVSVQLELDTGANQTDVRVDSRAGRSLLPSVVDKDQSQAAAGSYLALVTQPVAVQVGSIHKTLPIELVPGPPHDTCPSEGYLGMDILHSCVLAFSAKGLRAGCESPR